MKMDTATATSNAPPAAPPMTPAMRAVLGELEEEDGDGGGGAGGMERKLPSPGLLVLTFLQQRGEQSQESDRIFNAGLRSLDSLL